MSLTSRFLGGIVGVGMVLTPTLSLFAAPAFPAAIIHPTTNNILLAGEGTSISWRNPEATNDTVVSISLVSLKTGAATILGSDILGHMVKNRPDMGAFSWTVPLTLAAGFYRVEVTCTTGTPCAIVGDKFSVLPARVLPGIPAKTPTISYDATHPPAPDYLRGQGVGVVWHAAGFGNLDRVDVYLIDAVTNQPTGLVTQDLRVNELVSKGRGGVTLPASLAYGNYKIRVTCDAENKNVHAHTCSAETPTFAVVEHLMPRIEFGTHRIDMSYKVGQKMPLNWIRHNFGPTDRIVFYLIDKDTHEIVRPMVGTLVHRTGSDIQRKLAWVIPANVSPGQYRLMLRCVVTNPTPGAQNCQAISPGVLTITQ